MSQSPSKRQRIVLVEDHALLREGLRALLAPESDLEVVGEATDGREALHAAEALQPDLVMLDLSMPRSHGLEVLAEIKRRCPGTQVLVLTAHKTEDYVFSALQSGATGYVLKESTAAELLRAIRSVLAGERYLSPAIATQVVAGYLGGKEAALPRSAFTDLTPREREVLKLLAEGCRNKEIAEHLGISPKTVEKHRANLMDRLNLRTVPALTAYALEKGLISR